MEDILDKSSVEHDGFVVPTVGTKNQEWSDTRFAWICKTCVVQIWQLCFFFRILKSTVYVDRPLSILDFESMLTSSSTLTGWQHEDWGLTLGKSWTLVIRVSQRHDEPLWFYQWDQDMIPSVASLHFGWMYEETRKIFFHSFASLKSEVDEASTTYIPGQLPRNGVFTFDGVFAAGRQEEVFEEWACYRHLQIMMGKKSSGLQHSIALWLGVSCWSLWITSRMWGFCV